MRDRKSGNTSHFLFFSFLLFFFFFFLLTNDSDEQAGDAMVLHKPIVEGQGLHDGRVVLGALLELLEAEVPVVVLRKCENGPSVVDLIWATKVVEVGSGKWEVGFCLSKLA